MDTDASFELDRRRPAQLHSAADLKRWVRQARNAASPPLSQVALAAALGVTAPTVVYWEGRAAQVPSRADIARIALACNVRMPDLAFGGLREARHNRNRARRAQG